MTTTPVPFRPFPTGLPPYQVNTEDSLAQGDGEIVGLDDGGFVIVWNDDSHSVNPSGTAIMGQRFDALGNLVGSNVEISPFSANDSEFLAKDGSAITKLANGDLAIAYTDLLQNGDNDTYVRIVNPTTLHVVRDDFIDNSSSLQTKNPAITSFANNSYVVSYTLDNGTGNTDILARIVSPTGTVGAPITVRDNGAADADFSQLATLSNNNFVVVYRQLIASDHDISFGIYTATGSPIVSNQIVSGANTLADETDPDVAALANGGFVVAWTGTDASGQGIRATIYDNAGNTGPGLFFIQVNTTTSGDQNEASVVALKDGGFVVTWEDDGSVAVRAQRFDATGHKIGSEFLVKSNALPLFHGQPPDSPDSALLTDGRFVYALGSEDGGVSDLNVTTSIWDPRARVSDFNGDATTDLLLHNNSNQGVSVWQMNGTQVVSSPVIGTQAAGWNITNTADFNGDGKSDLLLQNPSTLQASVWLMDGTTVTSSPIIGTEAPGWGIVHTADFNGGGKSDLLLQNGNSLAMWLMDGGTVTSNPVIGTMASGWNLTDYGDFNNDGKTDLLLENPTTKQASVWLMNGTTVTSSPVIGTEAPGWGVVHVSDFSGDGKSDLLLQNGNTLAIWLMNGGTVTSNPVIGTIAPGWNLTHYGDFNGDGKTDLLLENPSTLQASVWLMNGTTVTASPVIGTEAPGWGIVEVTDFNADGKSDLLLENSNHDLSVWLMDGTTVTANPVIGHIASGWDFVGF